MTNTLPFWVLQHLYVILSLADLREIDDIKKISVVFELLHEVVAAFEDQQEKLKEQAQPSLKLRQEALQKDSIHPGAEEKLAELDKAHIALQKSIPDNFEWSPEQVETISNVVRDVIKARGTQDSSLSGWRRIDATNQIISAFSIKYSSL